jgi:hypothetical protein
MRALEKVSFFLTTGAGFFLEFFSLMNTYASLGLR